MWRFWWHSLIHRMPRVYSRIGIDVRDYYLCKCGKAWRVTSGWRRGQGFTTYEEVDPGPIREFKKAVAKDVATL